MIISEKQIILMMTLLDAFIGKSISGHGVKIAIKLMNDIREQQSESLVEVKDE